MDYSNFLLVLQSLSSSNNDVRREAEKNYEQMKQHDINAVLGFFCNALCASSCADDVRLQCAVLMRNVFRGFALRKKKQDDTLGRISGEMLSMVKNCLIEKLQSEEEPLVLRNICDAVADLAQGLLPHNQWPEIPVKLLALAQSEDPRQLSAGLRTLSELVGCLEQQLGQSPQEFFELIKRALLFPSPKVQADAIQFVSRVVEDNNKRISRMVTGCIPFMNQSLLHLASADTDLTTASLESYVVIAETDASFFKPQMAETLAAAFHIASSPSMAEEVRQLAVEFLLCCVEDKPKAVCAIPSFVQQMNKVLLDFILSINGEEFGEWMDSDAENRDSESRLYDIGEEGLDRLAKALEDQPNANVISQLFGVVEIFVSHQEWKYQFAGLMAIAQTVEYLPEESLEEYIDIIIKILLEKFQSPHKELRFAACQTLGQLALDHQPYVQERYYAEVLPAVIALIDDPHPRVQSHACSAFVNFAEAVETKNLLPYADTVMQKLLMKCTPDKKIIVQQQAITSIAVVAGVLDTQFTKYYNTIMPILTNVATNATQKEARTCRGKAIECMSIIALSIGKDACGSHANEMLKIILPLWAADADDDDPVKEYAQEAVSRFARTMQQDFVPYLPHVVPPLLKTLQKLPSHVPDEALAQADPEDMTYLMLADKCIGLKTSLIESQEQSLALLGTLVDVLGENYKDYIQPSILAIIPLLNYVLSDDIKQSALAVLADLIKTTRSIIDKHGGDKTMLTITIKSAAEKIFAYLDETLADINGLEQDIEAMIAGAVGLRQCVLEAGPGVLDAETIERYIEQILSIMSQSAIRRREQREQQQSPDCDEDDVATLREEERQEHAFRSALLEILGAFMQHHKNECLGKPLATCTEFVAATLTPTADPDDRALAIYLCDDIIEQLGKDGIHCWSRFLDSIIASIEDRKPAVRQAACYGIIHACKFPEYAPFADGTARRLALLITRDREATSREIQMATDNAVTALGELIKHHGKSLQQAEDYLHLWADYLPLKCDEEEAQRVHADFLRLVAENNPVILGPSNCNLPKAIAVFASIYKTALSNATIDRQICILVEQLGEQALLDVAQNLTKKQRNKLQRMCKDIADSKNQIPLNS